jgi:hypothetical protein
MGLDMYAYRTPVQLNKSVDFQDEIMAGDETNATQIAYWRKHPNLHGWMEALYYAKGGEKESFNCVPVELTREDLDALALAIIDESLPGTTGFFFGNTKGSEYNADLQFVTEAIRCIENGDRVFYDSWW